MQPETASKKTFSAPIKNKKDTPCNKNHSFRNICYNPSGSKYLDSNNTVPDADTDWVDETTRTGVIQQYNLSVSNGSEKGSSFFSLGYYKNLGIIKTSDFWHQRRFLNNILIEES